jgi:general stress protein 26
MEQIFMKYVLKGLFTPAPKEDLKKIKKVILEIRIAMMTSSDESGNLQSRPMVTQHFDEDLNKLYFFASSDSSKTQEVSQYGSVNLAYACPKTDSYVSITGEASLIHDTKKIKELWSSAIEEWFPEGIHDSSLCLICVDVKHAEYWDSTSKQSLHQPLKNLNETKRTSLQY